MRTLISKKFATLKFIVITVIITIGTVFCALTGLTEDVFNIGDRDLNSPEYTPNEIIVKFKAEAAQSLEQQITKKGEAASGLKFAASAVSLDRLNEKHKVKKIVLVFKDFKKHRKAIEDLKAKADLKEHFKKKYAIDAIRLTQKEEHILKRLKRSPKDAKIPNLERIYKIELEEGQSVEEAVAEYSKDPNVEYAEPNYIYELFATPLPDLHYVPNDYYIGDTVNVGYWRENSWGEAYPDMWGLQKIQAIEAWNVFDINENGIFDPGETRPGEGVVVGLIDSGVDYTHEDIAANIWTNEDEIPNNGIDDDGNGYIDDVKGWDFLAQTIYDTAEDNDPFDAFGHGTHCAGTIAAVANNGVGIAGIAPYAKIMALKAGDSSGYLTTIALEKAIYYAVDNGADILSNSWGGRNFSESMQEIFDYAYAKGCVPIAAAGNSDAEVSLYCPANIDKVITVASSDHLDAKSSFSNWGEGLSVAAPGGDSSIDDGPNGPSTWFLGRNILSLRGADLDMCGSNDQYYGPYPAGICLVPQFEQTAKYYRSRGTSMACPHVSGIVALVLSKNLNLTNKDVRSIIEFSADDLGDTGKDIYFGYGRVNAYKAVKMDGYISSPVENMSIHDAEKMEIRGSAYIPAFEKYELYYAFADTPQNTFLINSSDRPVQNGLLGIWSLTGLADGEYNVILKIVTADDGEFAISRKVIIDNVSEPPAFANLTNKIAVIGRLLEFKVEAEDPDDPVTPEGELLYLAANLPPGASFNPATQIFSWTPASGRNYNYVTFTVTDNEHAVNKTISIRTLEIVQKKVPAWGNKLSSPVINGDKIVWVSADGGSAGYNIYMYDLKAKTKTPICTASGDQTNPDIYGNRIVWEDSRNCNKDIYMYDLSTFQETRITNDSSDQITPAIYGDMIVWRDCRSSAPGIYMYNILTQQEAPIAIV